MKEHQISRKTPIGAAFSAASRAKREAILARCGHIKHLGSPHLAAWVKREVAGILGRSVAELWPDAR